MRDFEISAYALFVALMHSELAEVPKSNRGLVINIQV